MVAMEAGGLQLLAGMLLVTGLVVVLLSRVLHRWRVLFPPEVVGLDCVHGGRLTGQPRALALSRLERPPTGSMRTI